MRVTNTMMAASYLADIQRAQERILFHQKQAASGHRILMPSDDPIGTLSALRLQSTLDHHDQYQDNISAARSRLEMSDSAMSDLSSLYIQMKALIIQQSDDTMDADAREAAAQSVASALDSILAIANRKVEGRALFAGRKTDVSPFVSEGGGVAYKGDSGQVLMNIAEGQQVAANLTGIEVFGAVTSQVAGTVDLNPVATSATKLADLNNGSGVAKGSVTLGDGVSTQTIDLSGAETLGDAVTKLNTNTLGIVASITTSGAASRITLTKAGFTLTVNEVGSNTTAADLGIKNTTGALSPLNGTDLDPKLTDLTLLTSLNNGAGIAGIATGLRLSNGSNTGTVSFAGLTTVQELRNALNSAGLYVDAQLDSGGRKLNLLSTLNGAEFRVGENGGTTGAGLGLLSFHAATSLSSLNRGLGVGRATTATDDDLRITQKNGNVIDVNLSAATTIQNVLDAINTDPQNLGSLTATLSSSGGNGIVLTDTSGGAGSLTVTRLNDSTAAKDLGIEKTTAGAVITGDDVNPVVTGSIFSILTELQTALQNDDTRAIGLRGTELDAAFTRLLDARASAGGRLQKLEMTSTRLEEEHTQVQGLLSETIDADLPTLLTQLSLEQVQLQAALKVTADALQMSLLNFL